MDLILGKGRTGFCQIAIGTVGFLKVGAFVPFVVLTVNGRVVGMGGIVFLIGFVGVVESDVAVNEFAIGADGDGFGVHSGGPFGDSLENLLDVFLLLVDAFLDLFFGHHSRFPLFVDNYTTVMPGMQMFFD